ncbi:MAG: hypothetical protein ACRDMV_02275 [Streptosporangiales bacterium]
MTPTSPRASLREITDLTSWAAALTRPGAHRDPDEVAAFLTAKAALLARLTDEDNPATSTTEQDQPS